MVLIRSILICPECGARIEGPRVSIVELRRARHTHDVLKDSTPQGPGSAAYRRAHARLAEVVAEEEEAPGGTD
jgi:hypothetical protein